MKLNVITMHAKRKLTTALANVQIKYLFVNILHDIHTYMNARMDKKKKGRGDPQLTMHNIRDIHFKIYIYIHHTYTIMCKHIAKLPLSTD